MSVDVGVVLALALRHIGICPFCPYTGLCPCLTRSLLGADSALVALAANEACIHAMPIRIRISIVLALAIRISTSRLALALALALAIQISTFRLSLALRRRRTTRNCNTNLSDCDWVWSGPFCCKRGRRCTVSLVCRSRGKRGRRCTASLVCRSAGEGDSFASAIFGIYDLVISIFTLYITCELKWLHVMGNRYNHILYIISEYIHAMKSNDKKHT